jgi:hypothetical protein
MNIVELLFQLAVAFFEEENDRSARLVCDQILALGQARIAEAEHYLTLLDKRQKWLFEKALELVEDGDDEEARLLFRQVRSLAGKNAVDAEHYLELLDQRSDEMLLASGKHLLERELYVDAYYRFRRAANLNLSHHAEAVSYMKNIENLLSQRRSAGLKPILPPFSRSADQDVSDDDEAGQKASGDAVIRRTPHMDIELEYRLRPGSTFEVSVFVDKSAARAGEETEDLVFEVSPTLRAFPIQVRLLATGHFVIEDQDVKEILIERDKQRSNVAKFQVRVKPEAELAAEDSDLRAGLTAVFAFNGRISGRVSRVIEISGATPSATRRVSSPLTDTPEPIEVESSGPTPIVIEAVARPADLTVEVLTQPTNDGRHFWCIVRTPLLEKYSQGLKDEWNLPDVASGIVNGFMTEFTIKGMSKLQRIAALKGAGKKLFDASPKVFRELFWDLVDQGRMPRTIAIVSEEPYIPWELMIPWRRLEGKMDSRKFPLGVEFILARWTAEQAISARQSIPMSDCYVIAPKYVDKRQLKYAQDEAKFMLGRFHPPDGQAVVPADFQNISATFETGGKTVVHFACHGSTGNDGRQLIYLESEPPLSADTLFGMDPLEKAFEEKHPFVFLNACEVGREVPALSGVGGFADSFIKLGASAVVAPLWSVKDDLAHQVALEFYNCISSYPDRPFAQIVSQIRAKAYDPQIAEDTYAAYCFYGDPLGRCAAN